MRKILTAIGNENLNNKLLQSEKFKIITRDIQYKEGILEVLSINNNIDILIISEILDGEIDFKELISKVKNINEKIEIIVFLESENIELKSFLFNKGISKIYINNEIEIDTFIINLEENITEKTQELTEEIRKLKEIIKTQEENYNKDNQKGKVVAITGAYGAGKSILSCLISKGFSKKNKKTLLIDFDIFNNSINTIYNVYKKTSSINEVVKISKYEHLLYGMNIAFNEEKIKETLILEKMIEDFRNIYDVIIIDTTSNFKYTYLKNILQLADNIIYIVVPTIVDLKKALSLYEIYIMDFKISKKKIKIFINKENKYSVDEEILSKIFNVKK